MHVAAHGHRVQRGPRGSVEGRLRWLQIFFILLGSVILIRLFVLQIWQGKSYRLLATNQHELQARLIPERGKILVRDRVDGTLHPLATNRDAWTLYAVPREMKDPGAVARALAPLLPVTVVAGAEGSASDSAVPALVGGASTTEASLALVWSSSPDDPYEPIAKNLTTEQADVIRAAGLPGIGLAKNRARFYPENNLGGHVIGFVRPGDDGVGQGAYGVEGAFDEVLAGRAGFVNGLKDAGGRRLPSGDGVIREASNGSDVVLTIDRTIQHEVCRRLNDAVKRHGAAGGSVVVLEPQTGAVIALCSVPDFDPGAYGSVKDLNAFNNPVTFAQYEPGSIFKAFTMAIGLDRDQISPKTTYVDTGAEEIDDFTIKNSDGKAHGVQTMTQALDESLNTATIFVQRLVGKEAFKRGIEQFGFGAPTNIELTPEAKGDISGLSRKGSVFAATASFGQGISATPIQLAAGYAALANGGILMRPYIVDEILRPDGTREKTNPQTVGRAISARASRLITGMLVSAVELGHGKRAGVPGYYVAGKTGTAQVPNPHGAGYLKDESIGSFAGYAPSEDPRFVMVVKIDRPKDVMWAEASAAPLWGEIATFLLSYLQVPMERARTPVKEIPTVPDAPSSTPAVVSSTSPSVQ